MDIQPTPPAWQVMTETEADAEADRLINEAMSRERPPSAAPFPTSFRDMTPLPDFGPTPPVKQDDRRTVPDWALGTAVASIGIGAGVTGIGCGAWLILHGLAAVTLTSVLMVTLPLAALAALATAIGIALQHARANVNHTENHYNAPVTQHTTHTEQTARGLLARITNR
ncbi:hypothetical protein ACFQ7J_27305 [Streptomyces sp. NPDC056501]|uniref:hypothetical protein n=1 Tax=Streptomyces sp. NPDC056501 TaxID=3345841 RepID=UPI0036AB2191